MKNITIVIPCKNDPLITRCVASIDDQYPILIVFNGSPESFVLQTKKALKNKTSVSFIELQKPNLSWALEMGTRQSKTNFVLYMDSDCIFEVGALDAFFKAAAKGNSSKEVYKGEVVFEPGRDFIENMISKSRKHHTAEVLTAYKPPLMISKEIVKKTGGYAFDKRLIWREDSDLDNRIRLAKIKIISVPEGIIHHKSIDLKTDLRSTFRYGIGLAIADHLNIILTEVPRSAMSTFKSQGLLPAVYMLFRNRIYDMGYIHTRVRIVFGLHKFDHSLTAEHHV